MKNPLIPPCLALALGIFVSHVTLLNTHDLLLLLPVFIACTLLASWRSRRMFAMCCLVSAAGLGAMLDVLHRPGSPPEIDAGARELVVLRGCVVSPPAFYEGRDQFTAELAPHARAQVSMTIREGEQPADLRYGQVIEIEGRVRATRNFQNPGSFDYRGYLARKQIYWTVAIPAGGSVAVQPGRCGSRFEAAIFGLRTAALNRIDELYAGNAYATGLMEATLIGEKRKLEKIWTEHFRRTGTYHMLVIDGLHITVLAAFLLFLLRICFVSELSALLLTAAGAWLYALVSGFDAPAVRAAGGFTLYVIARYFYRRGRFLNLLAAAAIIYLIADPAQLFESGFQLSFLAVAAIGLVAAPLLEATSAPYARGLHGITEERRDPRLDPRASAFRLELRLLAETLHYWLRIPQSRLLQALAVIARVVLYAYEIAVVSTAIQIGVALPMAMYFHLISLTGLSANVIVLPLLALVVPIGFTAVFTGWHFLARIAEWLLVAGEKVADWHMRFEPNWRDPDPPLWLTLALTTALVMLAFAIRRSRVWAWSSGAVVLALFALVFWHPFPPAIHPGELELTAIDVGQGDSLLVCFPDSKIMLIDGGGTLSFGRRARPRFDIGEDVVSPYLWTRSVRKIDVVALTHAHDDHARGLPAVISNFHPTELWTGAISKSEAWLEVKAKADAENVKIVSVRSGRSFDFGGARIEVLSPPLDYRASDDAENDDSLTLRITYGQRSFLLTGDAEGDMESDMLASGEPLRADVLKVGHHGSNTSSTEGFLEAVAPVFAVISDGFANSFRHPHPQVLRRLAAHHTDVFRTDLDGLVTIRTNGRRLSVETYRGEQMAHRAYPFSSGFDF